MSTASSTLRLILIGEDKSASKAVRGVGDEADKSGKKMQTFHKVGTAAGIALAGGLALAAKGAFEMTKRSAEDQQAAARLAQTLQKATGATKGQVAANEDWITAQGKAFGVADDDLRPAISRLAVATGSLTKAQKLTKLAMDVSAGSGKSLESVTRALALAQNGNISGLSRLGIATKDAKGNTLSLTQVTKQLSDHYSGAAAAAAQTAAGKQKILQVQYHELQEQIGAGLLPVMSKLLGIGLRVVGWISNNTRTAGILIGVVGGLIAVTWAVSAAMKVWFAISKLVTAGQWLLNAALDANPIGLVVIALAALAFALVVAYKKSSTFRAIVQGAFHGVQVVASAVAGFFTNKIPAAFRKVVTAASSVLGWVKGNWPKILAILSGPFGLAVLAIARNWDRIKAGTSAVVGFIKARFSDVTSFIAGIPGRLMNMVGAYLNAGKAIGGHIISGIFAGLRAIGGFAGDLAGSIKGAVNSALHLPFTIKGPGPLPDFTIPAFARGVTNFSGGLALVGERGPEIVGLPRGADVYPNGTGPGMGSHVTINVNVAPTADKRAIGEEIVQALKAYSRVSGVRVLA